MIRPGPMQKVPQKTWSRIIHLQTQIKKPGQPVRAAPFTAFILKSELDKIAETKNKNEGCLDTCHGEPVPVLP